MLGEKEIIVAAIMVLLLFSMAIFWSVLGENITEYNVTIWIDNLGTAVVGIKGVVEGAELFPSIGDYLYTLNITPPYLQDILENDTIVIVSQNETPIPFKYYYVSQLAYPNDTRWCLKYSSPIPSALILPVGTVPLTISPLPEDVIVLEGGRLGLFLDTGEVYVCYSFIHQTTTAYLPQNKTATKKTTIQPQHPSATTSASGTSATIATNVSSVSQVKGKNENIGVLFGVLILILLAVGAYFAIKGKSRPKTSISDFLDERDKAIVNLLESRGPLTPKDMLEALGFPRSAFYRRINRLKNEGIIEQFEIGGKVYYKLSRKAVHK